MQKWLILFLVSTNSLFSQDSLSISSIKTKSNNSNYIIHIDNFKNQYTLQKQTLNKNNHLNYCNFQLGELTTVDIFNPLKLTLFYKHFNTVVILDNRLAEVYKLNFNETKDYKNITFTSTGFDNSLWLFNQNNLQLELYNYKTQQTLVKTFPINETVLDLKSNYNYCWLLTTKYLYTFNYLGSLLGKIPNSAHKKLAVNKDILFLYNKNTIAYITSNSLKINTLKLPKLLITRFFATNETLYIYHNGQLSLYQLKIN